MPNEYVQTQYVDLENPIDLDCGKTLENVTVAYETYGELNENKDNAILVLHALTGDAHAAGYHEGDKKAGWWDKMIGSGKAFDTDKYFVICSNILVMEHLQMKLLYFHQVIFCRELIWYLAYLYLLYLNSNQI